MADVDPLLALHYDLAKVGGLQPVAAPPYDVIDAAQRAQLLGQSPYNVVEIDLPQNGGDPYAHAAEVLKRWSDDGIVVRDESPALWALAQDYTGPDGQLRTRHGVFARVKVEDYGPGRIRPHERTHPGPKEDRLRLTRATRANLSPIFSLYDDPSNAAWKAVEPFTHTAPWGEVTDDEGTTHKLWRVDDPQAIEAYKAVLAGTELLIADGHHRYETARVYQQENARGRPRPDVPGGAAGRGPDRVPDAPAGHERRHGRAQRRLRARLDDRAAGHAQHRLLRRRHRADALPQGLGDRRRAPSRASRSRTGAWTRPCSSS